MSMLGPVPFGRPAQERSHERSWAGLTGVQDLHSHAASSGPAGCRPGYRSRAQRKLIGLCIKSQRC